MIDITEVGARRVCTPRFQTALRTIRNNCYKARMDHSEMCRAWTALVITSKQRWPDPTYLDASSRELQAFMRTNRRNLDRVWKKIMKTVYIPGWPTELAIPWKSEKEER